MRLEGPLEIPSILPSHGVQFHFLRISHCLRLVRDFFGPLLGDTRRLHLPTALVWPFTSRLLLGDMWVKPTAKFMLIAFNDDDDIGTVYSIFSFIFGVATIGRSLGLEVGWWQSTKICVNQQRTRADWVWMIVPLNFLAIRCREIAEVKLVSFFFRFADFKSENGG